MRFSVMKDGKCMAHLSPCLPPPPRLLADIANQSLHNSVASESCQTWSSGLLFLGKVYHFVPLGGQGPSA